VPDTWIWKDAQGRPLRMWYSSMEDRNFCNTLRQFNEILDGSRLVRIWP